MAAWLQLANIPVCESVAAAPWGTSKAQANEGQFGALTFPWLYFELSTTGGKPQRYRLLSLKREGFVKLNPSDQYAFMLVEGDSMNASQPYPIQAGDVVLVRRQGVPPDYKIVVANLKDEITGENTATLKRKRPDGLRSESSRRYKDVPLGRVAGFVGEVIAVAKPES